MYSWLLRRVLLPLGDYVVGQRMMHRLSLLEEVQWWPRERLHSYRDQLLRQLIGTVYREVPLYRELMDRARVSPDDIHGACDLPRLPIVSKDILRAGFPEKVTRSTGQKTYLSCSSGSTGRPFCVVEDNETAGWYRASFLLALEWAGWRLGEPHLQTGMTLKRQQGRRIKDWLLRCHYRSAYDLRDETLDRHLELIEQRNIQHVWGYPGSLYYLAKRALQRGWNRSLRSVVTWGDMLYPRYRSVIEQAFGVRVTDTYGCAEGMQIAAQCEEGVYHIHTLDAVVEFVNEDGVPATSGDRAHLVVTRLHAGPMPLIRYSVGDIGVQGSNNLCQCGRGYDTMLSIEGRDTDVVVTPSGNRLIVHYFTGILEFFSEVDSFQVVQYAPDAIALRLVVRQDFSADTAQRIVDLLKGHGAEDLRIEIELVDEIPLTPAGKRRFVINQVARGD